MTTPKTYALYIAFLEDILTMLPVMRNNFLLSKENEIILMDKIQSVISKIIGEESMEHVHQAILDIVSVYGIHSFKKCMWLFFGFDYRGLFGDDNKNVLDILESHFHPLSIQDKRTTTYYTNTTLEFNNTQSKLFFMKCFGIQLQVGKQFIITGYVDNHFCLELLIRNNVFLQQKVVPKNFSNFFNLKDFLLQIDLCKVEEDTKKAVAAMKAKPLGNLMKEFCAQEMYLKRKTILQFFSCRKNDDEKQNAVYAFFLFDLLSNENSTDFKNHSGERNLQQIIFDSFSFSVQVEFHHSIVTSTKQYIRGLIVEDSLKIPLEKQVMMLKTSDQVKEKVMLKVKDLKNKSEESASKCRQYVEGLLKIPFGVFRQEPILCMRDKLMEKLSILGKYNSSWSFNEISQFIQKFDDNIYQKGTKSLTKMLNKYTSIKITKANIEQFLKKHQNDEELFPIIGKLNERQYQAIQEIKDLLRTVPLFFDEMDHKLEKAIFGHQDAKRELKQIIAQMVHGNLNKGYALGFEGPPGVGKTSLAKNGLSECLVDEEGNKRPFYMIALGGDVNGSSIQGHHYTYLGSVWGSIVQILMDSKCLNPIILFDEVDKVSKTENGKEIIGVLTHILDSTQNDSFQDKYFNGINIDLSKVLFILSYNDVSLIDKILLDRIRRIHFKSLSPLEKLAICKNYFLPDLLKTHHLVEKIVFSDEVLLYLIDVYTYESGCRKLKELLNHIIGTINLTALEAIESNIFPLQISKEDIDKKYLKHCQKVRQMKIDTRDENVGVINCLYANDYGKGGILKSVGKIIPTSSFMELKLTGLLDGMMKESFEVAKSLAWSLVNTQDQQNFTEKYNGEKQKFGIHIHCGDGSINKSGTSAGIAITILFYSLFKKLAIPSCIAITGEATLDGQVTEIGALENKVLGGIKAGVTKFIFPKQNLRDYEDLIENNKHICGIQFFPVDTIQEVINIIFQKKN
jgi:ATP-dependent Lon protease